MRARLELAGAKSPEAPEETGKRGRKRDTDPKEDRRISEGWRASGEKRYEDYALKNGMTKNQVKGAVERHRKRLRDDAQ